MNAFNHNALPGPVRLYLGSREYKPDGFLTVDLDASHHPDLVADVTDLSALASESVDEIMASHILEHLPWPESFRALSEWARVLRRGGALSISIPDLGLLAKLIADGKNTWHATGLLYGLGRLHNRLEAHQFGYTRGMLIEMLESLGFGNFTWWGHDLPDASNGWLFEEDGGRIALSINIRGEKTGSPWVDPNGLYEDLKMNMDRSFDQVLAARVSVTEVQSEPTATDVLLMQRLHFALIEARQRIKHLESRLSRP